MADSSIFTAVCPAIGVVYLLLSVFLGVCVGIDIGIAWCVRFLRRRPGVSLLALALGLLFLILGFFCSVVLTHVGWNATAELISTVSGVSAFFYMFSTWTIIAGPGLFEHRMLRALRLQRILFPTRVLHMIALPFVTLGFAYISAL